MPLRPLPLLFASLAIAACGVGTLESGPIGNNDDVDNPGGGGDDDIAAADAAPEVQEYSLGVTPALGEINLGDQLSFTATLSSDNFEGPVSLSLTGVQPSWEVSYSPSETLNLVKDESVDVIVTVTVPTNAEAGGGALAFTVNGELGSRSATANMSVANQIMLGIPAGTGEGGHGIGGAIAVRAGTNIIFMNNDTTAHRIHAEPHQDIEMAQGDSYILNYSQGGNQAAYCHIHGENTGVAQFAVE